MFVYPFTISPCDDQYICYIDSHYGGRSMMVHFDQYRAHLSLSQFRKWLRRTSAWPLVYRPTMSMPIKRWNSRGSRCPGRTKSYTASSADTGWVVKKCRVGYSKHSSCVLRRDSNKSHLIPEIRLLERCKTVNLSHVLSRAQVLALRHDTDSLSYIVWVTGSQVYKVGLS